MRARWPEGAAGRSARAIILFAALLLPVAAHADTVAQRIDARLAEPRFASASWGIAVVSLDDGRTVYEHDAGRLLLPASTAKLYTAAFALERLGSDYRTRTDVLAAGDVRKGRLHGALVLRGRGDPTLAGSAWAEALAAEVAAAGIHRVDGDVVGDDTAFDGPPIGSGWEASDLQAAYGAQSGALIVDENTMTTTIARDGVAVTPDGTAVTVALSSTTAAGPLSLYRAPGSETLHVQGTAGDAPHRYRLSTPDPALTAARRLRDALVHQGVRVDGEARSVRWPVAAPTGRVVASRASPSLADILRPGLKRSQNLFLQSVFQLIGMETDGKGSAEDRASDALAGWLAGRGIGPSAATLEEGTGLSRHDLTTAGALARVLVGMDASPLAATWRGMLPVAGVDGTLAARMRGSAAEGNVTAKTGSMQFVNALAGYVTTKRGQRLAFAILLNNYAPPARSAMPTVPPSAEVDAIAIMLAEAGERL
ncbi:D-alanyl-D-alanine carboxypeptidase / D-alanyl-D-alanine-endopeptidase (penicillin-binding protein 4) [Luteibacter sp. UNCMF331Sha3.1]|uniref:D-alanyl-D-alanine carboxypeptidase/D-alanyl-D-alanine endopeptidase n=1 Tax=Luteibacter sp. UNCMF331Sha3.1 TaxID=1502760 RepID=UPI0008BE3260|nr:D-alanyl-D-alanine carboxypeptidase/D-alanyl-D-alanine-endopeptidase [Luteibacter sp. UNCMF331Sha3.1]SEN37314.1 D-alanyl-D-alanine carboxypeptidase / D-alanyl-D-alanine-endopeptidase (penicillin-binding protein 4) [Luteibacter sp. UNCMF331Sha3.1]